MNIIYVASLLTYDGIEHVGRSLARHLAGEHNLQVCGAIVPPGSDLLESRVGNWVVSADQLSEVDVVYMEGGWTDGSGGATERFPPALAESFAFEGGQLVVADVDRNSARKHQATLDDAAQMFGARVSFPNRQGKGRTRYLYDAGAQERYGTRYFASQMVVGERMIPALEGIDSLLVEGAVHLSVSNSEIAATGNQASTQTLEDDLYVDAGGLSPWATVNDFGRGHAALIAGWLSHDLNVDECPDNARWVSNLISLMVDRSHESAAWQVRRQRNSSLSEIATLLDKHENQRLERKSSFLVPVGEVKTIPTEQMQLQVGKSIAALANTDGGHVIIGQDDERILLGLGRDFASLKSGDRDGFEQKIAEYTDNYLFPRWETLGLRVHWITKDGVEVAIIEVPAQPAGTVVTLKQKGGQEAFYVRRGTRTDALTGQALVLWLAARQRR
ncbi:AlbA family DNA-binding domain-containing protein [Mycolicibacterium arenosum]|uniref:ATP-binding protein n=1 Tax=Mycolicibacterium arenosum TaxID=2952157 RepID=A0ABT1M4H3_9MYCO|nr:ATP-binding protein [Mycolicibacterium sp. CAU 1645]MCP9274054.1 ATP-binding protein [Mycolicibacterium sp. CAU 1645]